VVVSLYSALMGMKYCIQACSPQDRKELLEWIQMGATKMIRGLEHLPCEERLRELGLFNLEKALARPHCNLPVLEGSSYAGRGVTFYVV